MSKEAALAFLKKVTEDSDFQSKLVAFAAEQGYEFSVEELSETELEAAAGGAIFVKIKGIAGDISDKDHKAWSDLSSISGTLQKPRR